MPLIVVPAVPGPTYVLVSPYDGPQGTQQVTFTIPSGYYYTSGTINTAGTITQGNLAPQKVAFTGSIAYPMGTHPTGGYSFSVQIADVDLITINQAAVSQQPIHALLQDECGAPPINVTCIDEVEVFQLNLQGTPLSSGSSSGSGTGSGSSKSSGAGSHKSSGSGSGGSGGSSGSSGSSSASSSASSGAGSSGGSSGGAGGSLPTGCLICEQGSLPLQQPQCGPSPAQSTAAAGTNPTTSGIMQAPSLCVDVGCALSIQFDVNGQINNASCSPPPVCPTCMQYGGMSQ